MAGVVGMSAYHLFCSRESGNMGGRWAFLLIICLAHGRVGTWRGWSAFLRVIYNARGRVGTWRGWLDGQRRGPPFLVRGSQVSSISRIST